MQVIIAEKPSVAREIAAIVGATNRKDGFIEGNGYAVTWAFGHLVGLAMPQQYGIAGFRRENLPILPSSFILLPRQVREGKEYKADPGVVKQLGILRELFGMAERIIVATDAGREGELIFRYIYSYLECRTPFVRLWISSLTDRAIREGLQHLRPGNEYDNLYLSAKARSEADWIVGINASQALAVAAGRGVWSLGRVQTPTLAIICSRYLENKAFKPATYFRLKLSTAKEGTEFTVLSTEKFDGREKAEAARAEVIGARTVRVVNVERKEAREQPPLLYDLTTLQKEANSRYGFSAEKTLDIAQSLYEKKFITYPRTGSRYISEDVAEEIPALIGNMTRYPRFAEYAGLMDTASLSRRSVDNEKIADHHALLPTENLPSELDADHRIVYEMVAGRMLETFSGACVKENTSLTLQSAGHDFTARGSIMVETGWRAVLNEPVEEKEEDMTLLPDIVQGDELPVKGCGTEQKQTRPRPLHTESSLLAAMETAGRELSDEAEREAMKDAGIGTPATRAAIIETLFAREYVRREKKSLVPTDKGLAVYAVVRDKKIADVAMTGGWELALSKIATGEMDAPTFHRGIEVFASQIAKELLEARIDGAESDTACPRCGRPVVFYPKLAKCQNPDCGLTVWRTVARKELTDKFGVLYIGSDILTNPNNVKLYANSSSSLSVESNITGQIEDIIEAEKLKSYNIENLSQILQEVKTRVGMQTFRNDESQEEEAHAKSSVVATGTGFVLGMILYMFLLIYGSMVMQSVIEEKNSRVLEVMVSSVRPFDLMLGKILGVASVAVVQVLIWGALCVVGALAVAQMMPPEMMEGVQAMQQGVPGAAAAIDVNPEMLQVIAAITDFGFILRIFAYLLLFVFGGYLFYSAMFAAVGSAVDSIQDAQQLQTPITIPIILALLVMISVVNDPNSQMAFWFSMIPFTSPVVMMARIPYGIPLWEIILSLVILYASFTAMVWFAAKIYRVGIFMYGKKPTFKELYKWMRYKY